MKPMAMAMAIWMLCSKAARPNVWTFCRLTEFQILTWGRSRALLACPVAISSLLVWTRQKLMMWARVLLGHEQRGQVAITLLPHLLRLSGEGRALEASLTQTLCLIVAFALGISCLIEDS